MTVVPGSTNVLVDAHVERLVRSLVRWRLIFCVAIVVPAGCYGLFERQARRLDALGEHGMPTTATVTAVRRGGTVDYAYVVGSTTYTWNVAEKDVPHGVVGETIPIVYSPEDPALSRPGTERSKGTTEAASNRSFARKAVAGIFVFLAFNGLICDVRLRRIRKTGQTEVTDPQAYRTRLILTGVMLVPLVVLIFGWHLGDALQHSESAWPVVLGIVLTLAVLGGTGFYVLRGGRMQATARSARLLKWTFPLATGIAAIRLLAWLMGWQ